MAISNTRQFILLLWKNWLLQKRQKLLTFFQVLLPPLFSLILLAIRTRVKSEFISTPTIWNSTEADTALPPYLLIPDQIPQVARYWQLAYTPNDTDVVMRLVTETAMLLDNATVKNTLLNGVRLGRGEWLWVIIRVMSNIATSDERLSWCMLAKPMEFYIQRLSTCSYYTVTQLLQIVNINCC